MRKIKSLFKMAFAAALLFGSSGVARADYPDVSALYKTHTLTADIEIVDSSFAFATELQAGANSNFTMQATYNAGEVQVNAGFLGSGMAMTGVYDQSKGTITFTKTNYISFGTMVNRAYLGIVPKGESWTGQGTASTTPPVWQVTEDGNIVIPDFDLVTYNAAVVNKTVAHVTNIKVDGYSAGGGGGSSTSYPTIDELLGKYTFTAANYTSTNETLYPKTFDITIQQTGGTYYMNNFLNSTNNASVAIDYDQETGIISYKKVLQSNTWTLVPEDGGWTGWNPNNGTANLLKFKYDPETKGFILGNFTVQGIASNAPNGTILASYGNITILPWVEGPKDDTGDMGPDPGKKPTWQELVGRGNYYFTADVDIAEGMEAEWEEFINSAADSQFTFTTNEYGGTFLTGFLGSNGSKTQTYNSTAGTLSMAYSQTLLSFTGGKQLRVVQANGADFDISGTQWATVDNWGRITIAPFAVKTDGSSGQVVANFNNCRVNGFPVDGGGEYGGEEEGGNYPEASQLTGSHGWAANINVKNESLYNSYLVDGYKDNTFTISYNEYSNLVNVSGLLGAISDTAIAGTYNQKTGQVTFTNQALSFVNTTGLQNAATGTAPVNVLFNITNADAAAANGSWVWQVAELNEDGTGDIEITIPDFVIWNQYYTNPGQIAEYVDFELDGVQVFPVEPLQPSEDSTTVGTYEWYIQYNNGLGYSIDDPITTIQVEVVNGSNGYFVKEAGETNLFKGLAIPFTLQDGNATFTPTYVGDIEGQYIFSDITYNEGGLYMPMSSATLIPFDEEDGFTFDGKGVGFFTSSDAEEYSPEDAVFACFVLVKPETYPALRDLPGTYKFTSKNFTKNTVPDVAGSKSKCSLDIDLLEPEFLFTISLDQGKPVVSHFIYGGFSLGNTRQGQSTYDPQTGVLTFDWSVLYDGAYIQAGIAPGGEWGGISAGATKGLTLQFHEDGSITIPMFQLVKYDNAKVDGVYAEYSGNKAVPVGDDGEPEGPIVSNPEIEGIWQFTTFDIMNESEGGGQSTGAYNAYLNGNTVTFEEMGSGDAAGMTGTYHIVAKFIDETTLLVRKAVVSSGNASQPLNQVPFTNGKAEHSTNPTYLNTEEWTFKYNAAAGTLTPSGNTCGLWYANFAWGSNNQTTSIQGAFIVQSGKKSSDFVPGVTISNMSAQTSGNSATIGFNVETEYWDGVEVGSWKAFAQTYSSDGENDVYTDYSADATVNLAEGKGSATFTNLPNGTMGFPTFYIVAYDNDGNQIAKSNGKSITFDINAGMTLSDFSYTMGENNESMTVVFRAWPKNLNLNDVDEWKAYFRNAADGTTYTLDAAVKEVSSATVKYLEATVVFTELLPGSHDFYVTLTGYQNGEAFITSSPEYNWDANAQGVPTGGFGSFITVSDAEATVNEANEVSVSFAIELHNVSATDLTYEVILTPTAIKNSNATNAADGDLTFDFVPTNGEATVALGQLEDGVYAYNLTVNAYGANDLIVETLEPAYITFTVGTPETPDDPGYVDGIQADGAEARYFNLNGIEVKNPEKGIFIKIENGKVSKVVK